MNPRRLAALTSLVLIGALLTACTDDGAPDPSPSQEPTSAAGDAAATPAATDELTCESMISEGTVAALTEAGWTAEPREFRVGGVELSEGLLCFWADFTVPSDHGQMYGWSALSPADAERAREGLEDEGWRSEESAQGVYVTEDPQYAMSTDEDGYGMTYLFGDGWVKVADTKQGLLLVEGRD
ncbi:MULTISPECIES: hypothetical protein [unclassified Microbacterium]|jgi:hypothetical protein|uniref:hypothetical protein n=1 Tax=unclassified Microbacterium TaxID=2609290 RepID=UPI00246876B3|nr:MULTISPECIES: hypothetical protein [unclassified Microbacterium]MDH5132693.1 hypothetical protein [Microbacterium sp. RD10]MDH5136204.1 hypothetical protein [Microbacterium sp. RD11]MDH5145185.1 hypothetical protein [Microbacterium sp. RD12]MDH5154954.1 hypothetical protein [Microbacterium sp. RD06]MDH5165660.1 hypothetical protein [Microbacterium sp. RD02]